MDASAFPLPPLTFLLVREYLKKDAHDSNNGHRLRIRATVFGGTWRIRFHGRLTRRERARKNASRGRPPLGKIMRRRRVPNASDIRSRILRNDAKRSRNNFTRYSRYWFPRIIFAMNHLPERKKNRERIDKTRSAGNGKWSREAILVEKGLPICERSKIKQRLIKMNAQVERYIARLRMRWTFLTSRPWIAKIAANVKSETRNAVKESTGNNLRA